MEQGVVAIHLACPFGATSSVQAWQRTAAAVTFLARTLLAVLVFCYVESVLTGAALAYYIGCIMPCAILVSCLIELTSDHLIT